MIPRTRPDIHWSDIYRMQRRSAGCTVEEFEREFLSVYSYRHAVWLPSARVAIRAFLECVPGIGPERVGVAVSPFNCLAVATGIVAAGCRPVWVDVAPAGYNQDPALFAEALARDATLAGIRVPLWGIEDVGGLAAGKPVLHDYAMKGLDRTPAPLSAEDGAVYSFSFGKPITSFHGGVLCSNEPAVAERWRKWRAEHLDRLLSPSEALAALRMKVVFGRRVFGAAYRLKNVLSRDPGGESDAEAPLLAPGWNRAPRPGMLAVGVSRLRKFADYAGERAEQVRRYEDGLSPLRAKGVGLPAPQPWLSYYPLLLDGRDELRRHLLSRGVYTSAIIFDRLLSDHVGLPAAAAVGSLENARKLARRVLQLPLFHGLTAAEQARVVEAVTEWADGRDHTR